MPNWKIELILDKLKEGRRHSIFNKGLAKTERIDQRKAKNFFRKELIIHVF